MKQFLINLEQNQHDVLRMVAYQKKVSMAAVIREAFELYLKQNDAEYYNGVFGEDK